MSFFQCSKFKMTFSRVNFLWTGRRVFIHSGLCFRFIPGLSSRMTTVGCIPLAIFKLKPTHHPLYVALSRKTADKRRLLGCFLYLGDTFTSNLYLIFTNNAAVGLNPCSLSVKYYLRLL